MFKRLISLGLFAVTASTLVSLSRQLQRQGRADDSSRTRHEPVHTWEGEGGALPATGAQMGPDPAVPASTTAQHVEGVDIPVH